MNTERLDRSNAARMRASIDRNHADHTLRLDDGATVTGKLFHDDKGRAIAAGRMVRQPCETCGAEPAHGHHDDYSKPLDVRWLCPVHHREHHARCGGGK